MKEKPGKNDLKPEDLVVTAILAAFFAGFCAGKLISVYGNSKRERLTDGK